MAAENATNWNSMDGKQLKTQQHICRGNLNTVVLIAAIYKFNTAPIRYTVQVEFTIENKVKAAIKDKLCSRQLK